MLEGSMLDSTILHRVDAAVEREGLPPERPGAPGRNGRVRAVGWRSPMFWVRRPGLVLSLLVALFVTLWSFFPGIFTTYDPYSISPGSYMESPSSGHLFGTDEAGRDLYTRVVFGARGSLSAAVIAVIVAFVGGAIFGLIAGFRGGRIDDLIMRLVDVLHAIPALLLALVVVSALGFGTRNVGLAVGIVGIGAFTRLMRSEVLRVRTMPYVEAAHAGGVRSPAIIIRHVLPNSWGSALVLATLEFGTALLAISAISFLGFGTPPPTPEWGRMVADGRYYLETAWWLTTFPGIVLAVTVLAVNRISRALDGEADDD